MHQLTKDPSMGVNVGSDTPSSPRRTLTRFELTRYLDYCSEMLSLTSKVAALYAQALPDPVVTDAVSDIERIASGLSQKIWQKIMILQTVTPDAGAGATSRRCFAHDRLPGDTSMTVAAADTLRWRPGAGPGADPLQERNAGGRRRA